MENKKRILVIKSFVDDFEIYYNNCMRQEGITVWNKKISNKKCNKNFVIRQLQMGLGIVKNKWLNEIKNFEKIIIFDDYSLVPWLFILKKRNARIILWNWNIATPRTVNKIKSLKNICEIWTFDKNDAEQYGWRLNNQFFFNNYIDKKACVSNRKKDKTIFFVGVDKGRYKFLCNIYDFLLTQNINCDFYLVKEEGGQYNIKDIEWTKDLRMPYSQVLKHISECDAVLDIVQKGQSGFTLRVLEALFYHKKLITNNREIVNSNIYLENNIFVIENDNWEHIQDFMQKPYQELPQNILNMYTFNEWLENFCKP